MSVHLKASYQICNLCTIANKYGLPVTCIFEQFFFRYIWNGFKLTKTSHDFTMMINQVWILSTLLKLTTTWIGNNFLKVSKFQNTKLGNVCKLYYYDDNIFLFKDISGKYFFKIRYIYIIYIFSYHLSALLRVCHTC